MRARLVAALTLGAVLGATAALAGAAARLEGLRLERDRAQAAAGAATAELERLRKAPAAAGPRVNEVRVVAEHTDPRVAVAVEQRLEKELRWLVGRRVDELDPLPLGSALEGRVVTVDGRPYRLQLRLAAVGLRVLVFVRVVRPPGTAAADE